MVLRFSPIGETFYLWKNLTFTMMARRVRRTTRLKGNHSLCTSSRQRQVSNGLILSMVQWVNSWISIREGFPVYRESQNEAGNSIRSLHEELCSLTGLSRYTHNMFGTLSFGKNVTDDPSVGMTRPETRKVGERNWSRSTCKLSIILG